MRKAYGTANSRDPITGKLTQEYKRQYYHENIERIKKRNRGHRLRLQQQGSRSETYEKNRTAYFKVILNGIKQSAKQRGIEFNLDLEWIETNFTGYCSITGLPFRLVETRQQPFAVSVDRKDNSIGYLKDNCRFILLGLNMLKGNGTDEDMYAIADALIRNKK